MQVLLQLLCSECNTVFAANSHIACYMDSETQEPILCPECDSQDYSEIETISVG